MPATDRFVFLNEEGELSGLGSWNDPARGKLWLYNLHYFDDLNAVGALTLSPSITKGFTVNNGAFCFATSKS